MILSSYYSQLVYVCVRFTYLMVILVLSIEKRNASSNSPILFPLQDSPDKYNNNTEIDVTNSSILIPASLIQRRAKFYGMLTQQLSYVISCRVYISIS